MLFRSFIPLHQGHHVIESAVWEPLGTNFEEILSYYLVGSTKLTNTDCVWNTIQAKQDRSHLQTKTVGKIVIELDIVLRNWKLHQVET